jgi:hypothetical protein
MLFELLLLSRQLNMFDIEKSMKNVIKRNYKIILLSYF